MDGVVVWDGAWFQTLFPQFSDTNDVLLQTLFGIAGNLCDNTACSVVCDWSPKGARATILAFVTAHLATLMGAASPAGAASGGSGLVGRISNATEGSVSVSAAMPEMSLSAAFFNQTQPGSIAWQLLSPYRMALYVRGPVKIMDPYRPWLQP